MSAIGPGSVGGMNIAGSIAGVQGNEASKDTAKAQAADKKFQVDQKSMSAHGQEDVAEADLSGDRDADGHSSYGGAGSEDATATDDDTTAELRRKANDADGIRGSKLDLDA